MVIQKVLPVKDTQILHDVEGRYTYSPHNEKFNNWLLPISELMCGLLLYWNASEPPWGKNFKNRIFVRDG